MDIVGKVWVSVFAILLAVGSVGAAREAIRKIGDWRSGSDFDFLSFLMLLIVSWLVAGLAILLVWLMFVT